MEKIFKKLKEVKSIFFPVPFLIVLFILLLDQATKYYIQTLADAPSIITKVIENYFHIVHYRNKGAAWGIFSEYTSILALISLFAFVYILIHFKEFTQNSKFKKITISLLMGGIIGNWVDRQFFKEGVIDMIEFFIPLPLFISESSYQFPAFNIADSCITISFVLLVADYLIKKVKKT